MPRHLISDAHEWINEVRTVVVFLVVVAQLGERAWQNQRLVREDRDGRSSCVPVVLPSALLVSDLRKG